MSSKRLDRMQALKLIKKEVAAGRIVFSRHSEQEMKTDGLERSDVLNVLLSPQSSIEEPEPKYNSWRYRVKTNRICVVVSIEKAGGIVVITVFRVERK